MADQSYFSVGSLLPTTQFGATYHSYHDDGSDKTKFHDPNDPNSESPFPIFALGLKLGGRFWLGADYLGMRGESNGIIKKKVGFGPFRFFVTAPTKENYRFDIARLWLGYRLIDRTDEKLMLNFGLSAVQAKASARIEGLGQEADEGILPLPSIGANWSWRGPHDTRWSLMAEYAHLEVKQILGTSSTVGVSVEKPVGYGFSVGLGYKQHNLRAKANRERFQAEIVQRIAGPLLFIQQSF